jgi:hypothetical protein
MTRIAVATLVAFMMFATSGSAAWFARLDSGDRLAITGIATDKDGVSSTVTLTCADGWFAVEVLTRSNAQLVDLSSYSGTKVAISYKVRGGEVKKMQVEGVPKLVAGGILGIVSDLSVEQSRAVFASIARGYPLDIEIAHPDLIYDVGRKHIAAENFSQATIATSDHCQGLKSTG